MDTALKVDRPVVLRLAAVLFGNEIAIIRTMTSRQASTRRKTHGKNETTCPGHLTANETRPGSHEEGSYPCFSNHTAVAIISRVYDESV
jgi:hypothetical protein